MRKSSRWQPCSVESVDVVADAATVAAIVAITMPIVAMTAIAVTTERARANTTAGEATATTNNDIR